MVKMGGLIEGGRGEEFMRDWPRVGAAQRRRRPELMDQPGLDPAEHFRASMVCDGSIA